MSKFGLPSKWLLCMLLFLSNLFLFSCKNKNENMELSSQTVALDYYSQHVQPIFDQKCISCHSCYDAPCGLKLSSYDGFARGASKIDPYESSLIKKEPSRLYTDAKSAQEWHSKYFFWPVVSNDSDRDLQLQNSSMIRLLNLKNKNPQSKMAYDTSERSCPTPNKYRRNLTDSDVGIPNTDEMAYFERKNPHMGMPYGLPALTSQERRVIDKWIEDGAKGPQKLFNVASDDREVLKWENYLNQKSAKQQLSARYWHDHLFLARIHFPQSENNKKVYQLVRSSTPSGQLINEIATRTPLDKIDQTFYYRFREMQETVMLKNHMTYQLDDQRMKRYNELFIQSQWNQITRDSRYNSYDKDVKANPYEIYAEIPAQSRYQFMLDDAEYFVRSFIHGPVCNGGTATNVIDDHFWVLFLDPQKDPAVLEKNFLYDNKKLLQMPSSNNRFWNSLEYAFEDEKYAQDVNLFNLNYSTKFKSTYNRKLNIDDLWDGDNGNESALLTVFRHFNSATVQKGLLGRTPKTVWVLNYQIFETIYYNLVANFDVYGDVVHKASTRIFMESSRMSAEHLFLNLLADEKILKTRNLWNRGEDGNKKMSHFVFHHLKKESLLSQIEAVSLSENKQAIDETISKYLPRIAANIVKNSNVSLDCQFCNEFTSDIVEPFLTLNRAIKGKNITGELLTHFPEVSFLRLTKNGVPTAWYSILKNTAHFNVAALFKEDDRINNKENYIDFVQGFVGSYPNLYFTVEESALPEFMNLLAKGVANDSQKFFDAPSGVQVSAVLNSKYVVGRFHPQFWDINHQVNTAYKDEVFGVGPVKAGIFDLSRYVNIYN